MKCAWCEKEIKKGKGYWAKSKESKSQEEFVCNKCMREIEK